jgi:hypothetical protein
MTRSIAGRAASVGLILAFTALPACSDDNDPAEPTGVAEPADAPDASVRDLPGDGLEPTPDFDIENRQRNPIGPGEVTEGIDELQNGPRGSRDAGSDSPTEAGSPVSDAGAANGTN